MKPPIKRLFNGKCKRTELTHIYIILYILIIGVVGIKGRQLPIYGINITYIDNLFKTENRTKFGKIFIICPIYVYMRGVII